MSKQNTEQMLREALAQNQQLQELLQQCLGRLKNANDRGDSLEEALQKTMEENARLKGGVTPGNTSDPESDAIIASLHTRIEELEKKLGHRDEPHDADLQRAIVQSAEEDRRKCWSAGGGAGGTRIDPSFLFSRNTTGAAMGGGGGGGGRAYSSSSSSHSQPFFGGGGY